MAQTSTYSQRLERVLMATYKLITKHGHPNAYATGRIQEHVFVMSEMLGRHLTALEVVHHKDENKQNNASENLQLFATEAEHRAHHVALRALANGGVCSSRQARNTPEGRKLHNAISRKAQAKKCSTPEGRAIRNAASAKSRAKKKAAL
jgi:hypothetical protein